MTDRPKTWTDVAYSAVDWLGLVACYTIVAWAILTFFDKG